MKIRFSPSFFQHNKLKEIYYKSLVVKNTSEKFERRFQHTYPVQSATEKEILMMDIKWGATRKTVCRVLGAPRFICKSATDERDVIVFFKQEIVGEKAIIQCHFLKDQFYYAHIDFIASLSRDNKKVQEMVKHKYLTPQVATDRDLIVTDPDNNTLILEHNVYLHLDYLTGKPAVIRKIRESRYVDLWENDSPRDPVKQSVLRL